MDEKNFFQDIWNRIVDYPSLNQKYLQEQINRRNLVVEIDKLKIKIADLEYKPGVDDADYWNNKWKQSIVKYAAPNRKDVREYVKYRHIEAIDVIATSLIKENNLDEEDPDSVVLAVMRFMEKNLETNPAKAKSTTKQWVYQNDVREKWQTPEETLERKRGDCDDWGILMYYVIRDIFLILGKWHKFEHRLKCMAGNVNKYGSIPSCAGGHFYLNWLHTDSEFYTVETTYYQQIAISYFGKFPQKYNPAYGVIWVGFNENIAHAQNSLVVSKKDFEKTR